MARPPSGPTGNSARDLRDDFVGEPAELYRGPEPPKKTRKAQRVTTNTFHAKVGGGTSSKRADRAGHFRRGGFVRAKSDDNTPEERLEGKTKELAKANKTTPKYAKGGPVAKAGRFQGGGQVKKLQSGGGAGPPPGPMLGGASGVPGPGGGAILGGMGGTSIPATGAPPMTVTSMGPWSGRQPGAVAPEENDSSFGGPLSRVMAKRHANPPPASSPAAQVLLDQYNANPGGRYADGGQLRSENTEMAKAWNKLERTPRQGPEPDTSEQILQNTRNMIRTKKETGYKDGGKLSAAQRQSLPKSDFALPGAGKGPKGAGSGSYPINDRSHAKNALARSSGKPVAAEVRAKVKAKYPDMGKG